MTYNLRRHFSGIRPSEVLKEYKPDQKSLLAYEAYGRDNKTLDYELERFKSRCFRADFGHDQAVYLQDFVYIDGVPEYSILVSWRDTDVEKIILDKSAAKMGFKNPKIKVIALKKEKTGIRFALKPDRGFNARMEKNFSDLGKLAFGKDGGIISAVKDGMTILAYSSKNFADLVFVAGIDHFQINLDELKRKFVILLVGVISLLIILAMALITYFRVIFPLKSIRKALGNIEKGKLDFDFKTGRKDEVGLLTKEFSNMVTGLRERERLASMLSDQAVEVISSHDSMSSEFKEVKHAGVVLISDIRSFTTLCEEYEPKQITEMLNTHFAEMAKIIVANGGRIYKFIGDAIEAVFLDDENKDKSPTQRAFEASVDMLKRLREINDSRKSNETFAYKIGIGLAAGDIFCGGIGSSETRYDYAMLGTAFKRAEAFEAMTKPYSDCPLIFDAEINSEIEADWASKIPVDEANETAFRLAELPDEYVGKATGQSKHEESAESEEKQTSSQLLTRLLSQNGKLIRCLIFIVSAICVFTPFYGVVQARYFKISDFERQEVSKARSACKSVITRYKVARFQDLFLEEFIAKSIGKHEKNIKWNINGPAAEDLTKASQSLLKELEAVGIHPETLMSAYCDPKLSTRKAYLESDVLDLSSCNFAFEKGVKVNRNLYLELLRCFISCELRDSLHYVKKEDIEKNLAELTGKGSVLSYCLKDSFARLSEVSRDGKDQFMYWDCFGSWRTEEPDAGFEKASKLRKMPGVDNFQLAGPVMMFIPRENKDSAFIKIAKELMSGEGFECAFVNEKSECIEVSKGFPTKGSLKYGEDMPSNKNWCFETAKVRLKQGKFQIFLAKPIKKGSWDSFYILIAALSIVILIILYMFQRAIFYESGIAERFSIQFWLCLLAASIFPLTGVFMMNEWHSVEQKNLKLKLERQKLLSSFDELERRQFLKEVLDTERIDKFSASPAFVAEFLKTNKASDSKSKKAFEEFLNTTLKPAGSDTGPVRFHEMSVISHSEWQQKIYSRENSERKASTFNLFVTGIVKQIFKDLGVNSSGGSSKANLAQGVKEEMTMDAGLELSRMLFGPEVYFYLVHGAGELVNISAAGGYASIKMVPIPSIFKPVGIVFWYRLDQLHPTIREIVQKLDSDYAFFAESTPMYGSMKRPSGGGWFKRILDYARWAVATRMPLSERIRIGEANYLLEARSGKYENSTLFMGLAAEQTVLRKIEERRKSALIFIIIAILATIFLAVIVIADISAPINQLTYAVKQVEGLNLNYRLTESRKDELGELFIAFNGMVKGLAEKELMGKMVSKTARLAASDEKNTESAEAGMNLNVAIMYISVPKFDFVLETTEPKAIFKDLKDHIDLLCRIVLDNGGDIDKIIGDKLLTVFYDPDSLANSASLALKTIKEIRLADRAGELKFPVCLGLHSGKVLAGLLGVGDHRDFTVIGDTVNTAARIAGEAANLPCENYLLSQSIADLLPESAVELKTFGEVELKGKSEPLKLFRIS
jgi:class 3 adenylate cyclase